MKRLTIEQAENLPMREGFSERLHREERIWSQDNRTCNKMNPRIIRKFILKYVNKKFDDCYSDFIHKIKTLHISNKNYLAELKDNFKHEFSNFANDLRGYSYYYPYEINDEIILRNPKKYKRKRNKPEIGVTTLYKLDMLRMMQENYDLYRYAKRNRSGKIRCVGIPFDGLRNEFLCDDLKKLFEPYIVKVKVGTPLTGKDLIRYNEAKRVKYKKETKRRYKEREESSLYYLQEDKRMRRLMQNSAYKEFSKNVLGL